MDTTCLLKAGLTSREIKVYLALLEIGLTTTGPLVKKAGVSNSKIYETLERLINKGLASFVIISKIKHFQASDPQMLLRFLEYRKSEVEQIIPFLRRKQHLAKTKQESVVYEGLRGVKASFENVLSSLQEGDEYYVFTLGEELGSLQLQRFFKKFHKRRREEGIGIKLIAYDKLRPIFAEHYKECGLNVRYTNLKLPTGIFIYGDNVLTTVWNDLPSAFVISSKDNADRYRVFFKDVWKMAKP